MMMLSNRQRTISRKAASTAAQPMMRNCRRKFAMGARGGARPPPLDGKSGDRPVREEPHDDAQNNKAYQAVTAELSDHSDDVRNNAPEERQLTADQQRRDNGERQQHQSDLSETADPHLNAMHCIHEFPLVAWVGFPPVADFLIIAQPSAFNLSDSEEQASASLVWWI